MTRALLQNIAFACEQTRGLKRRASLLALSLILAACGSGSSGTTATAPALLPPPEAELYTGDSFIPALASSNSGSCYRFTDPTRGNRALSVQVRIPSDAPGARPVIVFSHGGGPRSECSFGNAQWGDALASAGYAVIHIAHGINAADREMACTAVGVPNCSEVMAMLYLRPGDVSAVISQIPVMAREFGLSERIDTSRLGVAGHSFGAYTVMTVAGAKVDVGMLKGKSFADSRIVSALALSPQGTGRFGFYGNGGDDQSWANVSLPVLTQTGLGDGDPLTGDARSDRRVPFEKKPAPDKMEAFLNELRATHNTFNLISDAPTEFHDWIRATGIAWFLTIPAAVFLPGTLRQAGSLQVLRTRTPVPIKRAGR